MAELLHDTNFWVLVSFIIFLGVAYKYGKDSVLKTLDDKINGIKTELESAEKIRVDAQELLAEYQRKHKDAMSEADRIIADARKHAEDIRIKAEEDMARANKRRENQLQEKLARLENNAAQEIQAYTAKIAINAARDILVDKIDTKIDKDIISKTTDNVSSALN